MVKRSQLDSNFGSQIQILVFHVKPLFVWNKVVYNTLHTDQIQWKLHEKITNKKKIVGNNGY